MSNNLELVGQRALVTGGTKGIGKAVVGQLREAGAIVLTTARTSSGDLTDSNLFVAADITTAGGCEAVTKRFTTASEVSTLWFMSLGDHQRP